MSWNVLFPTRFSGAQDSTEPEGTWKNVFERVCTTRSRLMSLIPRSRQLDKVLLSLLNPKVDLLCDAIKQLNKLGQYRGTQNQLIQGRL